jgi:plastocyanin
MRRAAALLPLLMLVAVTGAHATTSWTDGRPHSGKARHCGRHRCRHPTRVEEPVAVARPEPLPRRLGVDEKEYSVYPTHNPVGAGSVEFDVTNFGMDAHDFSIRNAGGAVLSSTPLASRASTVVTLSLPRGSYTLYCSLSDHESLGMRATLVVR